MAEYGLALEKAAEGQHQLDLPIIYSMFYLKVSLRQGS